MSLPEQQQMLDTIERGEREWSAENEARMLAEGMVRGLGEEWPSAPY
jgi:hypothetical protein